MRAASNNYVVKVIVGTNVYDYNAAMNCAGNLTIFSSKFCHFSTSPIIIIIIIIIIYYYYA